MPPKKKGEKVNLSTFLADMGTGGGSWADEMEDLPVAPAVKSEGYDSAQAVRNYRSGGGGGDRSNRYDRGDRDESRYPPRPERAEIPVPDAPPFTAFVGNLSFDTQEDDIASFVGTDGVKSVRLVRDVATDKPKGFGYVEVETRDQLVALLARSGETLIDRVVRISVAEPQKDRDDRTSNPWRRDGPPPTIAGGGRERGGFDRGGDRGGFGSSREPNEDRGERMGFGSKFVPSTDRADRPGFGTRRESSFRSSFAEGEDRGERMGMGTKFTPAASLSPSVVSEEGGFGSRRGPGPPERKPSEADNVRDWRSAPRAAPTLSRTASTNEAPRTDSAGASPQPPARRKLDLAPRSIAISANGETTPLASPAISARPSPFGDAAPVDTAAREKALADKLAEQQRPVRQLERDMSRASLSASTTSAASASDASPSAAASVTGSPSASAAALPTPERKPSANPFGAAKPIDTSAREREVEEKIRKDREEAAAKAKEEKEKEKDSQPRKILTRQTSTNSASSASVPGAPTGPKALQNSAGSGPGPRRQSTGPGSRGGSPRSPTANGSFARKQSTGPGTPPAAGDVPKSPRSSLRKEGFSYSTMARTTEPAEKPTANGTKEESGKDSAAVASTDA